MNTQIIQLQGISVPDFAAMVASLLPKPVAEPKLYTEKETCDILSISRVTLNELVNDGKINRIKIGKAARYSQDDITKFIEASTLKL